MINQQLLDFIKSQLLKGVDKETITKELIGGGWAQIDIDEGFNAINNSVINPIINPVVNPIASSSINNPILAQATNHSGKKMLLIIIVLFVIVGGTSGYFFRNDIPVIKDLIKSNDSKVEELNQNNTNQINIEKPQPQQPTEIPVVVETNKEQNLPSKAEEIKTTTPTTPAVVSNKITPVVKSNIVDCGTTTIPGMSESDQKASDCMEKQFKSCSLAKENINVLDPNENPFTEGPKTYYKAYNEILGYKDKFCLVKIAYITSQLPEWNNKSATCLFDNSKDLIDNNMWNSKCSGPLYDAINN